MALPLGQDFAIFFPVEPGHGCPDPEVPPFLSGGRQNKSCSTEQKGGGNRHLNNLQHMFSFWGITFYIFWGGSKVGWPNSWNLELRSSTG